MSQVDMVFFNLNANAYKLTCWNPNPKQIKLGTPHESRVTCAIFRQTGCRNGISTVRVIEYGLETSNI